jgi:hypothetical protein
MASQRPRVIDSDWEDDDDKPLQVKKGAPRKEPSKESRKKKGKGKKDEHATPELRAWAKAADKPGTISAACLALQCDAGGTSSPAAATADAPAAPGWFEGIPETCGEMLEGKAGQTIALQWVKALYCKACKYTACADCYLPFWRGREDFWSASFVWPCMSCQAPICTEDEARKCGKLFPAIATVAIERHERVLHDRAVQLSAPAHHLVADRVQAERDLLKLTCELADAKRKMDEIAAKYNEAKAKIAAPRAAVRALSSAPRGFLGEVLGEVPAAPAAAPRAVPSVVPSGGPAETPVLDERLTKDGQLALRSVPCRRGTAACRGYMQGGKCTVCGVHPCSSCGVDVLAADKAGHTCKDSDVAAYTETLKIARPCPNCTATVEKNEGCDVMFCSGLELGREETGCLYKWKWTTGAADPFGIHHNYTKVISKVRKENAALVRSKIDLPRARAAWASVAALARPPPETPAAAQLAWYEEHVAPLLDSLTSLCATVRLCTKNTAEDVLQDRATCFVVPASVSPYCHWSALPSLLACMEVSKAMLDAHTKRATEDVEVARLELSRVVGDPSATNSLGMWKGPNGGHRPANYMEGLVRKMDCASAVLEGLRVHGTELLLRLYGVFYEHFLAGFSAAPGAAPSVAPSTAPSEGPARALPGEIQAACLERVQTFCTAMRANPLTLAYYERTKPVHTQFRTQMSGVAASHEWTSPIQFAHLQAMPRSGGSRGGGDSLQTMCYIVQTLIRHNARRLELVREALAATPALAGCVVVPSEYRATVLSRAPVATPAQPPPASRGFVYPPIPRELLQAAAARTAAASAHSAPAPAARAPAPATSLYVQTFGDDSNDADLQRALDESRREFEELSARRRAEMRDS